MNEPQEPQTKVTSPLAMAEWIEMIGTIQKTKTPLSPLAMAEWIEIKCAGSGWLTTSVSASDGGVD